MIEGMSYVKITKRTTAPTRLICATAEYPPGLYCVDGGEVYYQAKCIWMTEGRRYGTKWQGTDVPKKMYPDDFWEYVVSTVYSGVRCTIVAPNVGDFLTVTGFWVWLERGYFDLSRSSSNSDTDDRSDKPQFSRWVGRCVLGGPPDIVHTRCGKGSVLFVSLRNYTEESWVRLIGNCECSKPQAGGREGVERTDIECPINQCIATTRFMRNTISSWVRDDCGPWRDTTAQLSVSMWRKRFYTQKVCRHGDAKAVKLERNASYGGRAECWYYGDIGERTAIPDGSEVHPPVSQYPTIKGTIYRCDVTSQYPSILATEVFPTRLIGVVDNITVADLSALLRYYGVIADVSVRTSRTDIPIKRGNGTVFPSGQFRTTLAGPDLLNAIERNEVTGAFQAAYYQLGTPLKSYAEWLLVERATMRANGDRIGECFVKSLSTAIGGKFSQRSTVRTPVIGIVNPATRWGPWTRTNPDGTVERFVCLGGVVFEEKDSPIASKLLSAVYCYLTAYGRVQMDKIREVLYPCKPYAQCTDGIWVSDTGLERLRRHGLSVDRTPGKLRFESRHNFARFFSANHYYIDGRWTLSGYKHGARVETDLSVTEYRDRNPVRSIAWKPPMAIKRECVKRSLVKIASRERIGDDGWLLPMILGTRGSK